MQLFHPGSEDAALGRLVSQAGVGDVILIHTEDRPFDYYCLKQEGILIVRSPSLMLNGRLLDPLPRNCRGVQCLENSSGTWCHNDMAIFYDGTRIHGNERDVFDKWSPDFTGRFLFIEHDLSVKHSGKELCVLQHDECVWKPYLNHSVIVERDYRLLVNNCELLYDTGEFDEWDTCSTGIIIKRHGMFLDNDGELILDATGLRYNDWKAHSRGIVFNDRGQFTLHVTN